MADAGVDVVLEPGHHLVGRAGRCDAFEQGPRLVAVGAAEEPGHVLPGPVAVAPDRAVGEQRPLEAAQVPVGGRGLGPDGGHRAAVGVRRHQVGHPAVAEPGGPPHGRCLAARHEQGRPAGLPGRRPGTGGSHRPQGDVVEVEEAPVVGHGPAGPQRPEDLYGLVGAGAALAQRDADGIELVGELAADAHADRDPPPGPGVEVGDLLGHDDRVVEREEEHGGAHPHPLGPRRHQGEAGDGLAGRLPREHVAALPDRLDRQALGGGEPGPVGLGQRRSSEDDAFAGHGPSFGRRRRR